MSKTSNTQKDGNVIRFEIVGTHEGPSENAIPKLKMTGKQHWTEKAQRYVKWKSHVVTALMDAVRGTDFEAMVVRNVGLGKKPIKTAFDLPAKMDLMIHWRDKQHGDPENIFGSIADALFSEDKYLAGSFDYTHDGSGMVEVTITLFDKR